MNKLIKCDFNSFFQAVDRLKLCAHRSQYSSSQPLTEMTKILSQLRKTFEGMVDKMFTKELRVNSNFDLYVVILQDKAIKSHP